MKTKSTAMAQPTGIIAELQGVLRYHQALGITTYPATPELVAFLQKDKELSEKRTRPANSTTASNRRAPQPAPSALKNVRREDLAGIEAELIECSRCNLHQSRSRICFGQGNEQAELFIVTGAPSPADDRDGPLFTENSQEGELLSRMLAAIGLGRNSVYIASVVKCCPAPDSEPQSLEIKTCHPFLQRQIETVSPKVVMTMGALAAATLLKSKIPLLRLRGRFHRHPSMNGMPLHIMPTFHPGYLLRTPEMKKAAWEDLQMVARKLQAS